MTGETENLYLQPPQVDRVVHERNFIQGSIFELRYPTVIDLAEKDPKPIANALRKKFPEFRRATNHTLSPQGVSETQKGFEFRCRRQQDGLLKIFESSLNLRIENYHSFEEFSEVCGLVLKSVRDQLDTDYVTRVGYRIVNHVPVPSGQDLADFVNGELVAPLNFPVLGKLNYSFFQIRGNLDDSAGYFFQYGVPEESGGYKQRDNEGNLNFVLDFDYYAADVDLGDVITSIERFHDQHYSFFWWCLGEESRKRLEAKDGA